MIRLNSLTKTYISQSKQSVDALKEISLDIADSGMVFILGKSGSGKSTLLNILGGIDSATSGEILVDGTSLASFKQADYDSYRNNYVGFVFQEFNLLADFNVQDNVSLALQLSKEESVADKVKKALEEVELSEGYLTRKIDELSGGEKQRVAIARAIVKDSRMILADEPTGNLDSSTGESIWNILKNLSKTKLVVVVTHDKESAERYADRTIEIADGKIIADSGTQPTAAITRKEYKPAKQRLSAKVIFKMGVNTLMQKKAKTISVVLLAVFTIFSLLLMQTTLTFSAEKTFAKFIKDNKVEYIKVAQGKNIGQLGSSLSGGEAFLKQGTKNYLTKNSDCVINGFIESKQDILDMGLTFVGNALELNENSRYITDIYLEELYKDANSKILIDGVAVKLVKEHHPIEFLIGKKVGSFYWELPRNVVAGVVETNSKGVFSKDAFPKEFYTKEYNGHIRSTDLTIVKSETISIKLNESSYNQQFTYCEMGRLGDSSFGSQTKIVTKDSIEDGLKETYAVTLAEDEIILSYEFYAKLFNVQSKWSYVDVDLLEALKIPKEIGQKYNLQIFDYDTGLLVVDLGEFTIAGIAFSTNVQDINLSTRKIAFNENTIQSINRELNVNSEILIEVASIANLEKFLVNFRNNYDGLVLSIGYEEVEFRGQITKKQYTIEVYNFAGSLRIFKIIFAIMAILLTAILVLMVVNLISASIINRKKEIGILSALGTSSKDLVKIFMIETLIISAVTYIVDQIAIIVAMGICNSVFSSSLLVHIPLFLINFWTFFTPIICAFGLLLLATLIPMRKIIKLKPIDAIKNLN